MKPSDDDERKKSYMEFAQKDYEWKVGYLTSHFDRMWNRFNYFVAIETALLGAKILTPDDKPTRAFALAGILVSGVWYVMGAEDRYLVRLYRDQVKRAAQALPAALWLDENARNAYRHVGQVSAAARKELRHAESRDDQENKKSFSRRLFELEWLSGWRWEPLSTTKLASLLPLLVLGLWITVIVLV